MARRPKPEQVTEIVKDSAINKDENVNWNPSVPVEETENELVAGRLKKLSYEPGTMSAPAFITVEVATSDDEVPLEAKGKLAQYITLLNNGERVGFFVKDGLIVGVA